MSGKSNSVVSRLIGRVFPRMPDFYSLINEQCDLAVEVMSEFVEGFEKLAKGIARKAPVALKTAMSLIDQGSGLDLRDGLQLELDGLKTIFATQDARTGLESILSGQKPNYIGK